MKHLRLLLIVLLIIISTVGCAVDDETLNTDNLANQNKHKLEEPENETNNIQKPLTESQIKKFLTTGSIVPLEIKNTETHTHVLSEGEKDHEIQFFFLSADQNDEVYVDGVILDLVDNIDSPVLISRSVSIPESSAVMIIIKDNELLSKAYGIKLTFEKDIEILREVNDQKGFIITNEEVPVILQSLNEVVIFSIDKQVLFKKVL